DAEITSYLGETLNSNLQGNIIDLCPVGALVSKPYAFTARPWELSKTESIDVMDALGSNIRVDTKGREVMRFLPRNHDGVNEEWLADKSRFVWDGLRRQRLDTPYVRENGKLRAATWGEALSKAAEAMNGKKVAGLVGDLAPVEAAFALKKLIEGLGGNVECRTDGAKLPAGNRSGYVGTATVADIDNAKMIQLIGTNPRVEAPVLNARIRQAWANGANIGLIGEKVDLTYEYFHMGETRADLDEVLGRKFKEVLEVPSIVIIGQGALAASDGAAVLAAAMDLCAKTDSKLMVLHTAAGRVGAMDVGAVTDGGLTAAMDGAEVIYNMGADEGDIADGPFVIYQGSHGDRGAHRADIILPAAAYTEENGVFVNTEGRPQLAMRAGFAPGQAKENWAILRALSAELGATLPYDSMAQLRQAMVAAVPHLAGIDAVPVNEWTAERPKKMNKGKIKNAINDYYLTNPIARASQLMAELSAGVKERASAPMAAE
ncbi:MAG: molybdopterin-dependent oxidoreductase, partial [Planktomarina sp.]